MTLFVSVYFKMLSFLDAFTKSMAHAFATVCAKSDIVIMCDTNTEVSNYYDRKCQNIFNQDIYDKHMLP